MAENSLPDNPLDSQDDESLTSSEEYFSLSNFNTAAVFGDSPVGHIPGQTLITGESFQIPEAYLPPPPISSRSDEVKAAPPPHLTPTVKLCKICFTPNPADAVYCVNCGTAFDNVLPVQSSDYLPPPPPTRQVEEQTAIIPPDHKVSEGYTSERGDQPPFFETGQVLDNTYKVLDFLGKGGFSDIYTVENTRKYFADVQVLKLVHQRVAETFSISSAEALRDTFRSQYKAWKVISEKEPDYIVKFHDVEIISGRVGLLMEFMEGGTLLDLVESWGGKPQTQEQLRHLVKLFIQTCRGLNVIHKHKLIHRDVKPQNFLLDAARERCKLCDFELLNKKDEDIEEDFEDVFSSRSSDFIAGTLRYMSPESFEGKSSIKSDIFSLGVMFYFLLSGKYPFDEGAGDILSVVYALNQKQRPKPLTDHNSLVSQSLDRLVQWCLEFEPEQRPDSLSDLIYRFLQLGISDEESNFSPVNLAQLLLRHLHPIDREWLIRHLEKRKFRSMSILSEFQHQDMIEEYCYTTSPREILDKHCAGASLYAIADALKISPEKFENRDDLVKEIVKALGFLEGEKQTHGLETIRRDLETSRIRFENAETVAECRGHLDHTFTDIERAVGLLISFYGQMLYGNGLNNFLAKRTRGKPIDKLTFGEKVGVLRDLCTQKPKAPLPERVERIFKFPIMEEDVFEKLGMIVTLRNQVVHNRTEFNSLHSIQVFGQRILQTSVELMKNLVSNQYTPRVVQITSLQNDIYGRHFYEGLDERGKKEKIFTTYGLHVGQLYWFVPLTNPARINPLIFPFDESEE